MTPLQSGARVALATASLFYCFSTALAATASGSDIALNPVTVTSQRRAITADQTLAPITVITRQDIAKHPGDSVPQLLSLYAGIDFKQTGGRGQQASLFLDGTSSQQTLVLIDGVRVNRGTGGGATLQFLNPHLIQRIEVVRGPRSALYGSGAIGGVIQIFTRRGGSPVAATLGGGSHGTEEASVHLAGKHGSNRVGLDVSGLYSRGIPTFTASSVDSNYHNFAGSGYVDGHIGPVRSEISVLRTQGNSEYQNSASAPLSNEDYRNEVDRLQLSDTPTAHWHSKLLLARALNDIGQRQPDVVQPQRFDHARSDQYSADWQNTLLLSPRQTLVTGLYGQQDHVYSLVYGTGYNKVIDSGAVYAEDTLRIGRNRLLAALRYTRSQGFGGYTTGNAEYSWHANRHLRFNLGLGTGYRAPSGTDLYGFGGNPNLNPERSVYEDASAHYRPVRDQRLVLRLFQNRVDNLITYGPPPTYTSENVGHARIRGVALGYRGLHGPFSWRVGAFYHQPLNGQGQDLVLRARRRLTAVVDYSGELPDNHAYSVGLTGTAVSRRVAYGGVNQLGGYTLLGLHGSVGLTRRLSLAATLSNLTDKDYATAYGYNTPGRTFFVTLRYDGG